MRTASGGRKPRITRRKWTDAMPRHLTSGIPDRLRRTVRLRALASLGARRVATRFPGDGSMCHRLVEPTRVHVWLSRSNLAATYADDRCEYEGWVNRISCLTKIRIRCGSVIVGSLHPEIFARRVVHEPLTQPIVAQEAIPLTRHGRNRTTTSRSRSLGDRADEGLISGRGLPIPFLARPRSVRLEKSSTSC